MKLSMMIAALVAAAAVAASVSGQEPAGTAFTYQGRLTENGSLVTHDDTTACAGCDFMFELYDLAAGGTALATDEQIGVPVTKGLFSTPVDFGDAWTGEARWLRVLVRCPSSVCASPGTYIPLDSDRQRLDPTPYALEPLAPWRRVGADIVFDGGGFVGINTSTPGTQLDVNGTMEINIIDVSGAAGDSINLHAQDGGGFTRTSSLYFKGTDVGAADAFLWWRSGSIQFRGGSPNWVTLAMNMETGVVDVPSGDLCVAGAVQATGGCVCLSDAAHKESVTELADVLRQVCALRGVSFEWARDSARKNVLIEAGGFIAQEVRDIIPEVVVETANGLAIDYGKLVPVLAEAIEEINAVVTAKDSRLAEQQRQIDALAARLDALEGVSTAATR